VESHCHYSSNLLLLLGHIAALGTDAATDVADVPWSVNCGYKFNIIRKKAAAMQRLASSTVATCNRQMQCAVETVCSVPACGTMLPLHLEL